LFRGPKGIGKLHLASTFAQGLLCEQRRPDGMPCGTCLSCRWIGQGAHPDLRIVAPGEGEDAEEGVKAEGKAASTQIRIQQIRAMQDWMALSSHRHGRRVALIHPAEAMNASTANALLKTLEEPPAAGLLVLVTHQAGRLLPTILSRCQKVDVEVPPRQAALAWLAEQGVEAPDEELALASGAPLLARERAGARKLATLLANDLSALRADPLDLADRYKDLAVDQTVDLLQKWVHDLLAMRLGAPLRYYLRHEQRLAGLAARIDADAAARWSQTLAQARALAAHPLNPRLVLEDLFLQYTREVVAPA
jgi:DNA polymerase-3 subunit delta'